MIQTTSRRLAALLVFFLLVAITAAIGAQFEPGAWYEQLNKPAWNPPNWIFPPVWTILYAGIPVPGWLVWRSSASTGPALTLWLSQLVANGLWSWLFFGLHRPGVALLDIVLLLGLIASFIVAARRHSIVASWLFVPYALWVAFAASLIAATWRAN